MTFLEVVHAKRRKLADVLVDDEYSGIREIVEELYPDRAHFIYELLQNAEDTGASATRFDLEQDLVRFEHNGRPFSEENILAITNIGRGSKREQADKIGRFGVGFKAVFAYSETPHVWSPTFSFKISELVLTTAIEAKPELNGTTRFEFPFNNPKKPVKDAYSEVQAGLNELAETTLLFLSHIEVIQWYVDGSFAGEVRRIHHSDSHIEITRRAGSGTVERSHFLRFSETVENLERERVAIAFPLDVLPNVKDFDSAKAILGQLRIVPASPGRVAVFFPAEKETSGLRFHLHAPFVPELSRASVKDTAANGPLFSKLATLAARSLHRVRDLGLLTADFLSVLPNPQDAIPERYKAIRRAIISEMNENPLTPTYTRSHAPAKYLRQAKASLKELLSLDDIEYLIDHEGQPPQWATSASQRNSNADRFLGGLAIESWDVEEFVSVFEHRSSDAPRYHGLKYIGGADADFTNWLASRPCEWHQHLYAFLYRELGADSATRRLKPLRIVRLSDGTFRVGSKCYFPDADRQHDDLLPRVEQAVYSSGKNKGQQGDARKLLECIGVREVGEAELVQEVLQRRYRDDDGFKPNIKDIERFAALVEKDSTQAGIFSEFLIFQLEGGEWARPTETYLDSPVSNTGLHAYFRALGDEAGHWPLSSDYTNVDVPLNRVRKFAQAVGARTRLEIEKTTIEKNPERGYLERVPGERVTNWKNEDYWIPHLEKTLARPTVELSQLVWRTMCRLSADSEFFKARYQKNDANGSRYADSQLIHTLRKCQWVPQSEGVFVRPADADQSLLPSGFPFDSGCAWLEKIKFGQGEKQRMEQTKAKESAALAMAKELGFPDKDTLKRVQEFASLPVEEQTRFLMERSKRQITLPERESKNPNERATRIAERASEAPERRSEQKTRAVSVGLGEVKKEVQPYLQGQYTNADGQMICQICKEPLPFKLDNGEYYFEKVEFLLDLKKLHLENYLALCPNHSAMYQHANSSRSQMLELFEQLQSNELAIVLAQTGLTVYFTKMHIADLRAVIEADGRR